MKPLLFLFGLLCCYSANAQDAVVALIKTGVVMDVNGNSCDDPGDTIVYTFTVTNEGILDLENPDVLDPLIPGVTYVMGDLDGDNIIDLDETWTYTATYTMTSLDIAFGTVLNQAEVSVDSAEGVVMDLSDDDSVLEDDPTEIELVAFVLEQEDQSLTGLKLYPNPASDQLWFEFDQLIEGATVSVYTIDGELVSTHELGNGTRGHLDISALQSGIYFCEIVQSKGSKTIKFIKN